MVRMVMINMFIAIIIENFYQAQEQDEAGVTEDDLENFYLVWEKYDPYATQFIKLENLYDLIAEIRSPLGVPKPNIKTVTSFNLPIIKGDLIHCLDVLYGLTANALGKVETSLEFNQVKKEMDEQFLLHFPVRVKNTPITTTIERKRQEIAAQIVQRAWKRYLVKKSINKTNLKLIRKSASNIQSLTEVYR